MTAKRILVVGAIGTQGGTVVDALQPESNDEREVYGLTRSPESGAARALADRGVTIVAGDLTDRDAMDEALSGMNAAFGVTTGMGGGDEREQGDTLVAAAEESGISHLVMSTGGNCDDRPGIPHIDAKADIEERIGESNLQATVLRPHSFTSNFEAQREAIETGELPYPMGPDDRRTLVDPADIGRLAARAFDDPNRFAGETIELAADSYTFAEVAAAFSEVVGHEVEPVSVSVETFVERMGAPPSFARFFEWQNESHPFDPDRLPEEFDFEPTDLKGYLEREW